MAHRAPRPSDTGAGAGRRPREGGVTMLMGRVSKTEGRRGSQRRLNEGGRYLGIPQNGGLAAPRTGSDDASLQRAITISGLTDHDPPDYAITIAGIRTRR